MDSAGQRNNTYSLMLKNFSENGRICVADMPGESVSFVETEKAFRGSDVSQETIDFESKFKETIEAPMDKILSKIGSSSSVVLQRTELETVKKYILLQLNGTPYSDSESEEEQDLWKRETSAILDMEWDDLMKSDLVDVLKDSAEVNNSFLLFFRTKDEFVIGDTGCVTESVPGTPEEDGEEAEDFINYNLFPLSSEIAVLLISLPWKMRFSSPSSVAGLPLRSPILEKYRSVPKMKYVNERKIRCEEDVSKYKNPKDRFTYMINNIALEDLHYLNTLTINQSEKFVGFKTPGKVVSSFQSYNSLKEEAELTHDLSRVTEKIQGM